MQIWVVGQGPKMREFKDANEAHQYRGTLVHMNGHHKYIPIFTKEVDGRKWRSQAVSSRKGDK